MADCVHIAEHELDCVVIGAGPAGLQLGYFLETAGRSYVILEATGAVASFFRRFPRQRELISFNKVRSVYTDPEIRLRWDWNSLLTDGYELEFREFSDDLYPHADDLARYLEAFAAKYALKISYNARVANVHRDPDGHFAVRLDDGRTFWARYVVVATGLCDAYVPPIPGVELAEGYETVSLDVEDYRGQKLLIIGKGNSAFELADAVLNVAALVHLASPHPVKLAWKTKHPGHVRAQVVRMLDMYQLKLLNGALDCTIESIVRTPYGFAVSVAYSHAAGERETMLYDRVVRCTGFRYDEGIFDETCRPTTVLGGRLPAMTPQWESTTAEGLFYAGTLMQARDFKRASSAFIDGFRYNIRTLHRFLEHRFHGRSLLDETFDIHPSVLAGCILERVSRTSALWAQFGFLCDAMVVDRATGAARFYLELPIDYVHESDLGKEDHYYTISFEWGSWDGDVFAIERHPAGETADKSVFLHPVLRRFSNGRELAVHHVLEDLFGMYRVEGESGAVLSRQALSLGHYHAAAHVEPLRRFFETELRRLAVEDSRPVRFGADGSTT
jgi:thioredoxin reductase